MCGPLCVYVFDVNIKHELEVEDIVVLLFLGVWFWPFGSPLAKYN